LAHHVRYRHDAVRQLPRAAACADEAPIAGQGPGHMNTAFLLMAQYGARAVIPIELVCRDYFGHLTPAKLVAKVSAGDIALPLVRIEASQKCAKGVHLADLATYLDTRAEAARKELRELTR
jgi:hypothetical protein